MRFLRLLRTYFVLEERAEILAYCLMPNHYRLLIRLLKNDLSTAMQAMTLSYAKVFNTRYGRVGRLFQAPFRGLHVGKQEYLSILVAYIHRNPVEAGLVENPEEWEFSSYQDHVGLRTGGVVTLSALSFARLNDAIEFTHTFGDRERNQLGTMTAD